jgi:hypothetical protein
MERFYLRKLNDVETEEHYQAKISDRLSNLENWDGDVDINERKRKPQARSLTLLWVETWTGSGVHPTPFVMCVVIIRPGYEANHSCPSSAEVKNAWSYTSIHPDVSMTWWLVKHRDNFMFY